MKFSMVLQSSDRVPLSQAGMLCAVLVLCWVGVSHISEKLHLKFE